jgi:anti-anti-sigma regulatory factor
LAAIGEPTATVRVQPPPHRSSAIVLVVGPPIAPAEVMGLCERVRRLLEHSNAEVVVCDVDALDAPDLAAVDLLARLALTARQLGQRFRFRRVPERLHDLWCLMGLDLVVPLGARLRRGSWREAEEREEALRVEEERHPVDPLT